jgi:hypothetical protein
MSQLLSLLAVANGAPVLAKKLFGRALFCSINAARCANRRAPGAGDAA